MTDVDGQVLWSGGYGPHRRSYAEPHTGGNRDDYHNYGCGRQSPRSLPSRARFLEGPGLKPLEVLRFGSGSVRAPLLIDFPAEVM